MQSTTVFIGGGNMARAIIGGLVRGGQAPGSIAVVDPNQETRDALQRDLGVAVHVQGDAQIAGAALVVWAVKPQVLRDVMQSLRPHLAGSLHLSIAAGVTAASMQAWMGTDRIVRAMPNTPALVGKGMTGLFAAAGVDADDRAAVQKVAQAVGQFEWVEREEQLDAVTALSGSGPAYVFYFLEAMQQAGEQLGLPREQAYRLAVATFEGASALAAASSEAPEVLRQRVTSKGGTTFAATSTMDTLEVKQRFVAAMQACHDRAAEMAREFG